VVSIKHGGGKADGMTDPLDRQSENSARGEKAWKQTLDAIAARNERAQKAGRERREAYERQREEARRAAETSAHARLLESRRMLDRRAAGDAT
jgi:hypothetical protein